MATSAKRIRFPLVSWGRSGGIRVVVEVANHLARQGWQVEIVIPEFHRDKPSFQLDQNVRLTIKPASGPYTLAVIRYLLWMVFHACQGADLCLATYYLTAYPVYLSWLLTGRQAHIAYLIQAYEPVLFRQLGSDLTLRKRVLAKLAQATYRLPFNRVAVSESVRQLVDHEPITVIPNGVDLSVFQYEPDAHESRPVRVGAIVSEIPIKGYTALRSLFAALSDEPGVRLTVLVSSPTVDFPLDNVETLSGGDDASMVDFYRACDVFVFTSILEGFGLPPLEAMACGVPTVMTDCGGIREYASEENALIAAPGDIEALRQAVLELARSSQLRARLREAGLQTASKFTVRRMVERYERFLSDLYEN